MQRSQLSDLNRREFLKRTSLALGGAAAGGLASGVAAEAKSPRSGSKGVSVVCAPGDATASGAPVQWAIEQLEEALTVRGVPARRFERLQEAPAGDQVILVTGRSQEAAHLALPNGPMPVPDAPECLGLIPTKGQGRNALWACGSDPRGLTYALLELADRVTYTQKPMEAFDFSQPVVERPANVIRSVNRSFVSDVEDKPWFNDRSFWRRYLAMLAAQRFNRFALTFGIGYDFARNISDCYFHFAYPFLLAVPGHNVRAVGLPDDERDHNLEMLKFISDTAARCGLHFQLGLWTHAYEWADSPHANYTIEGLTPETHATYCRDAVRALLEACPAIEGLTFRIHGESGVAEANYGFWNTVFEGVAGCGRQVEIDMHAKGIDAQMIDVALATGLPVNVSPKYWAEHMGLPYHQAAIRAQERPPREAKDEGFFARSSGSRRFLRYGYGDLLAENRRYGVLFRLWPGTQRLLLWGDPAMAAGYGRASSFCGSLGMELCEPLSFKGRKGSGLPGGRDAYSDVSLKPVGGDWEKYLYTYRLWGRLLYNPAAAPDTWRRFVRRHFGRGAESAEMALSQASRILPLLTTAHTPSAANNNFWPEIYTNMPIVDAARYHPYGDTPSPKRFGTVSPLDPELFLGVDEFAEALLKGKPGGKYSPIELARWLHALADTATHQIAQAEGRVRDRESPEFRRWRVDVNILSGLGRFYAWKFRAGVLYALFERSGSPSILEEALGAYRKARQAGADLAFQSERVYVNDITFGRDGHMRGYWGDRFSSLNEDLADMVRKLDQAQIAKITTSSLDARKLDQAMKAILGPSRRPQVRAQHQPPASFRPGQPVSIRLVLGDVERRAHPVKAQLRYRHVNQAEVWQAVEMETRQDRFQATIPADYTDSAFPLQYFFELQDALDRAWLHPGLNADLSNQPYFVVRQAKR
jgi:hypothetical protein